jgi:hypothetical protein
MGAIPGTITTDQQPPMTIPLRHFLVGLCLLGGGVVSGLGLAVGAVPGLGTLAHVHLLLAGWICVTIMGAMTQFVPVWSGTSLYSPRLARAQLTLVVSGLLGFVAGLVLNALVWLVPFGGLMLTGFWLFAYNIARTLATVESYDVTERHFLLALGFFAVVPLLGLLLVVDFSWPVFANTPIDRPSVVAAHATSAVFGVIITTVYGALYQLGTMFTQTELHGVDEYLQSIEEVGHPVGVALLALGRFVDWVVVARIGAILVVVAALAVGTILARKLSAMRVDWTPMHTRYAVAVPGLLGWALLTAPAWIRNPTAPEHLFGAAGTAHLFVVGAIGFVVLGTLYHIIPFIVWVHRYSDRLGFEDVPMIDDLYDDRLAATDATALIAGTVILVVSELGELSTIVQGIGGSLVSFGLVVFGLNMVLVIRNHSPHPLGRILCGSLYPHNEQTASTERSINE